jgi:hypothetical protein
MRRIITVSAITLALAAIVAAPALAGRPSGSTSGGKGGGKTGGTSYTGTFQLVLTDSTDGVGHYGQNYTFNVQTSAPYPFVKDECYQGGTLVYRQTNGYYPGWMWGQVFNWSSNAWTGGAADCTATLYYTDSQFNNPKNMGTLSFHVSA